jgi:hypothetical protein
VIDPKTGVETPQGTPAPAAAPAQGAASPAPAQGAAPAKPAEPQGQKFVPISAMHEERDRRQAAEAKYTELQSEIQSLKAMVSQYQPGQPPQQQFQPFQQPQNPFATPYQQAAPQPIREQIDALWEQDVRKGFQAEMMAMMQYQNQVAAKVEQEADFIRSKAPDFSNYESKVKSYIRTLPLEHQAQPNIVQAAYLMMRGQDTDNIIKAKEAEMMKRYQGGAAAAGMNGTFGAPQPASDGTTLSQEELSAAQAMGMKPEEYLKWR